MSRLWTTITIIILLLVFVGYMVFDLAFKKNPASEGIAAEGDSLVADQWFVSRVFEPGKGRLYAVFVTNDNQIILAGESFIAFYDSDLNPRWEQKPVNTVTAVAYSQEKVYAASGNLIEVFSISGEKIDEWGPYGDKSIITSISSNDAWVAFADAGEKRIFVLDKDGIVKHMTGDQEGTFIIPSPYFDVVLGSDNTMYAAHTGKRRIERRNIDGSLIDFIGTEGTDEDAFCGCCNPAHFAVIPGGYLTAEKGINRIKILDFNGKFIERVSFSNKFIPSLPLDVASPDGNIIYAANPADSKLYIFKRI